MASPDSAVMDTLHGTEIGCYIAYSVGISVLLLRLYTRAYITHSLGLDDIFIIGGACTSTAIIVTVRLMFKTGIGRPIKTLTLEERLHARQITWISLIFYNFALGVIKSSIVALYLRLTVSSMHRIILFVVGGFILSHGIAASIITTHVCTPISVIWSPTFPRGCMNLLTLSYFNSGFNIISDIVLAVLPIPVLARLNLPKGKKIGLSVVFGVGILTIGATIARQVSYFRALHSRDFSKTWSRTELLTNIEINMAITFACVPALQTLFNACCRSQVQPDQVFDASSPLNPSSDLSSNARSKKSVWWGGRKTSSGDSIHEITTHRNSHSPSNSGSGSQRHSRHSRHSTHSRLTTRSTPSLQRNGSADSTSSSGGGFIIQSTDGMGAHAVTVPSRAQRGEGKRGDDWPSLESGVLGATAGTWKGHQSVSAGRSSKVLVKGEDVIPLRDWSIVAGSEGGSPRGGGWKGVVKSVDYKVEYS